MLYTGMNWRLDPRMRSLRLGDTESQSERLKSLRLCRALGQVGIQDTSTENILIYVPARIYKNAASALSTHMIISSHSCILFLADSQSHSSPSSHFPICALECDGITFSIATVNQGNVLM